MSFGYELMNMKEIKKFSLVELSFISLNVVGKAYVGKMVDFGTTYRTSKKIN